MKDRHWKFYLICSILLIGLLIFFYFTIQYIYLSRKIHDPSENAFYFFKDLFNNPNNLDSRLTKIQDVFKYEYFYYPLEEEYKSRYILDFQVGCKVYNTQAEFLMIQGKRKDALNLLSSSFYVGNLLKDTNDFIIFLIGIAIRNISVDGFYIYGMNCCETEDELLELWNVLEKYGEDLGAYKFRGTFLRNHPLFPLNFILHIKFNRENIIEGSFNEKVGDVKFNLLRMAIAARYHFLCKGSFPQKESDFKILLKQGIPLDPFSNSKAPFRFFHDDRTKEFIVYSIGPDAIDSKAGMEYDPTNGIFFSPGDIFMKVPQERSYPFPKNGLKANNAQEVKDNFPHGLPRDFFVYDKGSSLGVSNTSPVYIYSYGPDRDEQEASTRNNNDIPEVMYDPTNGIVSNGDLWICVPLK